jgi:UDP-2-acetamido-3-amino-2,3-dideoxy-glucuronate N-acetyltransferase
MAKDIDESVSFGQSTVVGQGVRIGKGTKVWHFVNLYGCQIGENCVIASFCEIGRDVRIGSNCKIESRAYIPTGVEIEDEVFIGPSVTFTNDKYPSARGEWKVTRTLVKTRASIGANSTILCGVTISQDAMVGAGSVVTKDVAPCTLVVGNPAKKIRDLKPKSR